MAFILRATRKPGEIINTNNNAKNPKNAKPSALCCRGTFPKVPISNNQRPGAFPEEWLIKTRRNQSRFCPRKKDKYFYKLPLPVIIGAAAATPEFRDGIRKSTSCCRGAVCASCCQAGFAVFLLHPDQDRNGSLSKGISDLVFALDFYFRPVVFGQQKAPMEAGGGVKTWAYQLVTPAVDPPPPTQPDSLFPFPNTLGATG